MLTVSIQNTGTMQSILSQWKMFVRRADGRVDQLRVTHIYGPISIGTDKGQRITFSPTDFIYEKLAEPLPVGAYETGRIMGMSSDPNVGNLAERDEFVLQAKDVM